MNVIKKQKFYNFTGGKHLCIYIYFFHVGPFVLLDNLMRTIATSKLDQPFNQIEIGKYIHI